MSLNLIYKATLSAFVSTIFIASLAAQVSNESDLFNTIYTRDSLLFEVGFNTCNLVPFQELLSEDTEFYHDQSGDVPSKEIFMQGIENGLCKMSYRAERKLDKNSMEVFPMYKNGKLYGAVQEGTHRFYAHEKGKEKYLTSVAKFNHLWLLEDGKWKLSRVLSYNHQVPKD